MLVAASREIGGRQIQNRGTLGGNIANASPAGDSLPVLAAADATIVLQQRGRRARVPFNAFYTGYRASVRRPDEMIVAIESPADRGHDSTGERSALDARRRFPRSCARPCAAPRCAWRLGSVAPTVVRLRGTERVLTAGELAQASAGRDARRNRADRRHPIDGRLSTRGQRQPAR